MTIIVPANTLAAGGFDVDNSVRFNDGDSAYMHKTAAAGNRRTFTFSTWFKRGQLGTNQQLFNSYSAANAGGFAYMQLEAIESGVVGDRISLEVYGTILLKTTQVLRDPSSWYHLVIAVDTTSGTANNRCRMYLNGTEITNFVTRNNPDQNFDFAFNQNNIDMYLGSNNYGGNKGNYFDGYMAEVVWIDGTQYAASDFGEFDEDSNIWKPIDVSGLTFGTNGFYLDFKASGNLGNDANGGTDLTEVNLAATDQSTDTCTNNFATLNPLHSIGAASELSQGNLEYDPAGHHRIISTIAPTSGKWYAEVKGIDNPDKFNAGVAHYPMPANGSASSFAFGQGVNADVGRFANDFGVKANGDYGNSNSYSSYMASLESENNNIVGIYLDLDNYKIYFSKNGTLVSSTGKNLTNNGEPYGFISVGEAGTFQWNFGNPSFALANTAITDDNGFGAFEYSPNITGDSAAKKFYALCTKNLAEFG